MKDNVEGLSIKDAIKNADITDVFHKTEYPDVPERTSYHTPEDWPQSILLPCGDTILELRPVALRKFPSYDVPDKGRKHLWELVIRPTHDGRATVLTPSELLRLSDALQTAGYFLVGYAQSQDLRKNLPRVL
jgi:hypothetical protein